MYCVTTDPKQQGQMTGTSETMSQNKTFLLLITSGILSQWQKAG
jgi:hypothetical protein